MWYYGFSTREPLARFKTKKAALAYGRGRGTGRMFFVWKG